jgi:hypothetical protein
MVIALLPKIITRVYRLETIYQYINDMQPFTGRYRLGKLVGRVRKASGGNWPDQTGSVTIRQSRETGREVNPEGFSQSREDEGYVLRVLSIAVRPSYYKIL